MPELIRPLLLASAILVLHASGSSAQVTYDVLADFAGTVANRPLGGVVAGPDGMLYGTTHFSDTLGGCGAVYKVMTDGTVVVLHEFSGSDGCNPVGELAIGLDGALYGTTVQGGPNASGPTATQGTGTIFKIAPSGVFASLHAFARYDDVALQYPEGIWPYAGLTFGVDGNLYGLTNYGGQGATGPAGTFFTITPAGAFALLHSFEGSEGAFANSGLTLGADGNFYGTATQGGGNDNLGSVFKVTPAGAVTRLFAFPGDSNCVCAPYGSSPVGEPILDSVGNMYGTTLSGGPGGPAQQFGTVWRLSPTGDVLLLHAFTGGMDGANPLAGLTLGSDGNLYGTTFSYGVSAGGVLFQISSAGTLTTLHSFVDPAGPDGRLVEVSPGTFVGTTQGGGTGNKGLVFRAALGSATTTALDASPRNSVFGQPVTFTGSVSAVNGTPTGQVEFFDDQTSLGTALLSGGTASLTTASLGVGGHTLSADYLSDGGFSPSSSFAVSVAVSRAQTTTTLASSPNPSSRKQVVTVTATVAAVAPGAGVATGQVQFFEGKKKLGTVPVINGVASLRLALTSMGQHVLTATYGGESNFSGSTAAPLTQTVTK